MKKSILAVAGLAAVAGVAPFGLANAADTLTPITDTVTVTIDTACSLSSASGSGADIVKNMTNNSLETDLAGSVFTVKCNDVNGWHLSAIGAGDNTDKTQMKPSKTGSTAIATGTTTGEGNPSAWAFKVTGDKTVSGFNSYSNIPSAAADVALDTTSAVGQAGTTVSAFYQVWIGDTQQADTYVGKVTYTLAHPKA